MSHFPPPPPSFFSPCDCFTNPENALPKSVILIPNLRNVIGINLLVKLYLNLKLEPNLGSTFLPSRHYPVEHTQWFITLISGIQWYPVEGRFILSNRPHITTVGYDARRRLTCGHTGFPISVKLCDHLWGLTPFAWSGFPHSRTCLLF